MNNKFEFSIGENKTVSIKLESEGVDNSKLKCFFTIETDLVGYKFNGIYENNRIKFNIPSLDKAIGKEKLRELMRSNIEVIDEDGSYFKLWEGMTSINFGPTVNVSEIDENSEKSKKIKILEDSIKEESVEDLSDNSNLEEKEELDDPSELDKKKKKKMNDELKDTVDSSEEIEEDCDMKQVKEDIGLHIKLPWYK